MLTNLAEAKQGLDGTWYLIYTASISTPESEKETVWKPVDSAEGSAKIDTNAYQNIQGKVGAAGVKVETANRLTKQIFDVEQSRVTNFVEQDFGSINVEGTFRVSKSVPTRAVVAFEKADIAFKNGFVLKLGFVFRIFAFVKGGVRENGWLETTYLDEDTRIGRGNKGSLFVLTRQSGVIDRTDV